MRTIAYALAFLIVLATASAAWSAPAPSAEVGSIVNLKGSATIERPGQRLDAKLNDKLQLQDTVSTGAGARVKMLFLDESILTLAPNSKVSMMEFVYGREGGGITIFNLIEGKMRTVVGKNRFEVHTSTTIAAARGTVIEFEVGILKGKHFTRVRCLEGTVEVRSSDPNIPGSVLLHAGEEMLIIEGEPLPNPVPFGASGSQGGGVTTSWVVLYDDLAGANGEPPVLQAPTSGITPPVTPGTPVPVKIKIIIPRGEKRQ